MARFSRAWGNRLFRVTHALILPLSILVIASLFSGLSSILRVANFDNKFATFLDVIGSTIFDNMSFLFGAALVIYFVKLNKVYALFSYCFAMIIFYASQHALINSDDQANVKDIFNLHSSDTLKHLIAKSFNLTILNMGYFGSFTVAILTVYAMNHWSNFKLIKYCTLFSRERLIPFILTPLVIIQAVLMIVIWPYIGIGMTQFLIKISHLNYGFGSFFYGIIKTILKPFGFDYVFSSLILETGVGGVLILNSKDLLLIGKTLEILKQKDFNQMMNLFLAKKTFYGQKNILDFVSNLPFNSLPINSEGLKMPILQWFNQYLNIGIGNFTQDYSVIFGVYPGISLAILLISPKEKRKQLCSIIIPALFIAIFIGITEPFEFLLLFALPLLYFVLYVPLVGVALMIPNLLNVHVGGQINHGLIDFITQGIMIGNKGSNWWIIMPLSFFQGLFALIGFYFLIKPKLLQQVNHSDYSAIYFSKKHYNELINWNFIKQTHLINNGISLKEKLQAYILTNIKNGNWAKEKTLPSEKALAIKFNCSRLTARNALSKYVDNGLLISKRGQGYFINHSKAEKIIDDNHQSQEYHSQSVKIINKQQLSVSSMWLENSINIDWQAIDLNKTHNIEKKYFDQTKRLSIYEITILNNYEIKWINNGIQLDESWLKSLSLKSINFTRNYSKVIFIDDNKYLNIAQELGWNDQYPLIISILMRKETWVAISFKILSKSEWQFSSDYQVIS